MKTKKIQLKDVVPGMKIKTFDPDSRHVCFKEITDVFNTNVSTENQVKLTFVNGTTLNCSVNHPIMVFSHDYMSIHEKYPLELDSSDFIVCEDGFTFVKTIERGQVNDVNYIDITVEDTHTFYASSHIDEPMVLTHNSQGAVRGASATFNYPIWHSEFESLIELKNNKGTDETRLRVVDYCVHLNKTMYERLVADSYISFFSPDEVPDLYDAFYGDSDTFKTLYEKYEQDKHKVKKQLPAKEVFAKLMTERYDTGRIYIMNADHVNTNTPFKEKIYMSNLCLEICIATSPLTDNDGEIALCTLSAINVGKVETPEQMKEAAEMSVRGLDSLLTYQEYPNVYAKRNVENYRPLGVGVIGFAHWLAKNNLQWGSSSENEVDALFDDMMYNLISTSVQLSKEYGSCGKKTKYHDGIMPGHGDKWEALSIEAKTHGIRNAVLSALMPSETSSTLSNETNGIEPPKDLVTIKGSKDGVMPQVVPEIAKIGHRYQKAWDVPVQDYLYTVGVMQKYVDQAISANTSYNPYKTEVTASVLVKDLLFAYKQGVKTLYYNNTLDDAPEESDGCESGACKI